MELLLQVLSAVGAVVLGLPMILRAVEGLLALMIKMFEGVSGSEPEQSLGKVALALAKVREWSEKLADLVGKLLPKSPKS